jgi:predicted nucleotide-binding protein
MDQETVEAYLTQRSARYAVSDIEHATQLRCSTGEIVVIYHTGRVVVQGRRTEFRDELQRWVAENDPTAIRVDGAATRAPRGDGLNRDVFVVYGHDRASRDGLELLLHKLGMNPIVLGNLTPDGNTVIEALEQHLIDNPDVQFACVLLTPDDEGYRAGHPDEVQFRARQNVILELGMVLGHLRRRRVAIFYKDTLELPSDITGMLYIPYKDRVDEQANMLFRALDGLGYKPDKNAL